MKVGVIGLGAMGSGMARNLAAHRLLAGVWNRTVATGEAMAGELGVELAASPADLAVSCDAVITCVAADNDVLEMVQAMVPALAAGKLVIDTSTVSADSARRAAETVAATGARFLDAPLSGGREGAQNATMVMMVGGDDEAFAAARPVFAAISKSASHMGGTGQGQATKAVNQIMVAGINQAVTEALAFGQASGLNMDDVIDVVGGGAAGNWLLQHRGPTMVQDRFEPGFKAALHHKDLTICQQMLDTLGVTLPIVEMTLKHYERLMERGYGDEDISTLYRLKREAFEQGNQRSL